MSVINKWLYAHEDAEKQLFNEKYGKLHYRRFNPLLNFKGVENATLDNADPQLAQYYKEACKE
jgi:hypothetical protein